MVRALAAGPLASHLEHREVQGVARADAAVDRAGILGLRVRVALAAGLRPAFGTVVALPRRRVGPLLRQRLSAYVAARARLHLEAGQLHRRALDLGAARDRAHREAQHRGVVGGAEAADLHRRPGARVEVGLARVERAVAVLADRHAGVDDHRPGAARAIEPRAAQRVGHAPASAGLLDFHADAVRAALRVDQERRGQRQRRAARTLAKHDRLRRQDVGVHAATGVQREREAPLRTRPAQHELLLERVAQRLVDEVDTGQRVEVPHAVALGTRLTARTEQPQRHAATAGADPHRVAGHIDRQARVEAVALVEQPSAGTAHPRVDVAPAPTRVAEVHGGAVDARDAAAGLRRERLGRPCAQRDDLLDRARGARDALRGVARLRRGSRCGFAALQRLGRKRDGRARGHEHQHGGESETMRPARDLATHPALQDDSMKPPERTCSHLTPVLFRARGESVLGTGCLLSSCLPSNHPSQVPGCWQSNKRPCTWSAQRAFLCRRRQVFVTMDSGGSRRLVTAAARKGSRPGRAEAGTYPSSPRARPG